MTSSRYAAPLLALLCLALVPTVIHSYIGVVIDDGLRAEAIPSPLAGFTSTPGKRDATWGRRRFDSDDWIARRYSTAGDDVVLTVVRSFDLKTLYHHPELAVAYDTPFSSATVTRLPQAPGIPIHVLRNDNGAVGLYALLYDGAFVEDPIWFQLRTAGRLLVSGRRAMTLAFVQDPAVPPGADIARIGATKLLLAALDHLTTRP